MAFSILRLFRSSGNAPKDGLTQPQREAIADLLHYCMYADNKLMLSEAKAFEDVIAQFDWDSPESFASFEMRSITRARKASETRETDDRFLASVAERLDSEEARLRAVEVCTKLLSADGSTSVPEKHVLAKIRAVLAPRSA